MRRIRNNLAFLTAALIALSVLTSSCLPIASEETQNQESTCVSFSAVETKDSVNVSVLDPETAEQGRLYTVQGTLKSVDRYKSGNILFVLSQSDLTEITCYIRKDSGMDGMSLTIGETYAVSGELDEYEGNPELIVSSPSGIALVGGYHFEEVTVVDIVDGDTIRAEDAAGNTVKIRFVGCNCPETQKEGQPGEFYAGEATRYTSDTLLGKTVYLEKDHSETDRYGRLLRFIWLQIPDEITEETIRKYNFSATLIENGYAACITVGDDTKYASLFQDLENTAASEGVGMWSEAA